MLRLRKLEATSRLLGSGHTIAWPFRITDLLNSAARARISVPNAELLVAPNETHQKKADDIIK